VEARFTVDTLIANLHIHPVFESLARAVQTDRVPAVYALVSELCDVNTQLWDTEDCARDALDDMGLAAAKRDVDRLNLQRNTVIEQVDEVLARDLASRVRLAEVQKAPMHTETVGSVVDRLVILALRVSRTRAASVGNPDLAVRIAQLESQLSELDAALAALIEEVVTGARRLPDGRRFKLYGSQRESGRR
jgi:hypothetical protein